MATAPRQITAFDMGSSALISKCGRYRYFLTRGWGDGGECTFIMLNPSVADAEEDDPTIRRCIGFARRSGYGSLRVVNLFALRATKPDELRLADDPVGPSNDEHIVTALGADLVIAAWGAHGGLHGRDQQVIDIFKFVMRANPKFTVHCLGHTQSGQPKHPLYLAKNSPLKVFWTAGSGNRMAGDG